MRSEHWSLWTGALALLCATAAFGAPHFTIVHAQDGIYCAPQTVTVYVQDAAGNPLTSYNETMTLDTGTAAGSWASLTSANNNGTLNDGAANDGVATYAWPGNQSSATFVLSYPGGAATINLSARQTNDASVHDTGALGTGGMDFALSGFIITSSPFTTAAAASFPSSLTAGATSTLYITAYGQTSVGGTCGTIATYTGTKSLQLWSTYINPGSGTRNAYIPTSTAIGTSSASPTTRSISFASGKSGNQGLKYPDVGALSISIKDPGSGAMGSTGTVVFKPSGFTLSAIKRTADNFANPAAANSSGIVFIAAGEAFSATVTALESGGTAAPNFGHETPAETAGLNTTLVSPTAAAGGHNPNILAPLGFATFTNGVSTGTDFSWPEVGIIKLTAHVSDGNYLDAGDTTGTASGNVGRFKPAKFSVSQNAPTFTTQCAAGHYSYVGQYFKYTTAPVLTVTAQTLSGVTTQNYTGSFRKLTNTTLTPVSSYTAAAGRTTYYHDLSDTDLTQTRLDNSKLPATTADPTIVDLAYTGSMTLTFNSGTTGLAYKHASPLAVFDARITVNLNVIDSDGVTPLKTDNVTVDNPVIVGSGLAPGDPIAFDNGAQIRYGRVAFRNAVGPEIVDLVLPMRVEYYKDDTQGFIVNTDESSDCAKLTATAPLTYAYQTPLNAGNAPMKTFSNPPVSGDYGLSFQAPGAGKYGTIKVTATVPTWLQFDWDKSTTALDNPVGVATFGVFKGNDKRVYQRELY